MKPMGPETAAGSWRSAIFPPAICRRGEQTVDESEIISDYFGYQN
jgi:hypothetical protein